MAEAVVKKRVTPPYSTPAGLNLFFEKIKTLKPASLTTKWAEDNELPFADAIVNTMKFLGAAQKDGALTPEFAKLRLEGEPFRETLAGLVTSAYSAVFDQVDDVRTISESDLNNAFKTAYDVGSPGRYVRPFLMLCELSGLREATRAADHPRPRAGKPEATSPATRRASTAKTGAAPPANPRHSNVSGAIQVILQVDIPWDAPIDEVRARVRAIAALDVDSTE